MEDEETRDDRDTYIDFHDEMICSTSALGRIVVATSPRHDLDIPYDLCSVMHNPPQTNELSDICSPRCHDKEQHSDMCEKNCTHGIYEENQHCIMEYFTVKANYSCEKPAGFNDQMTNLDAEKLLSIYSKVPCNGKLPPNPDIPITEKEGEELAKKFGLGKNKNRIKRKTKPVRKVDIWAAVPHLPYKHPADVDTYGEVFEGDIQIKLTGNKKGADNRLPWACGYVPYRFANGTDKQVQDQVELAMKDLQKKIIGGGGNLRFEVADEDTVKKYMPPLEIVFKKHTVPHEPDCYATLGQSMELCSTSHLVLSKSCLTARALTHLLLHVLGLPHEHWHEGSEDMIGIQTKNLCKKDKNMRRPMLLPPIEANEMPVMISARVEDPRVFKYDPCTLMQLPSNVFDRCSPRCHDKNQHSEDSCDNKECKKKYSITDHCVLPTIIPADTIIQVRDAESSSEPISQKGFLYKCKSSDDEDYEAGNAPGVTPTDILRLVQMYPRFEKPHKTDTSTTNSVNPSVPKKAKETEKPDTHTTIVDPSAAGDTKATKKLDTHIRIGDPSAPGDTKGTKELETHIGIGDPSAQGDKKGTKKLNTHIRIGDPSAQGDKKGTKKSDTRTRIGDISAQGDTKETKKSDTRTRIGDNSAPKNTKETKKQEQPARSKKLGEPENPENRWVDGEPTKSWEDETSESFSGETTKKSWISNIFGRHRREASSEQLVKREFTNLAQETCWKSHAIKCSSVHNANTRLGCPIREIASLISTCGGGNKKSCEKDEDCGEGNICCVIPDPSCMCGRKCFEPIKCKTLYCKNKKAVGTSLSYKCEPGELLPENTGASKTTWIEWLFFVILIFTIVGFCLLIIRFCFKNNKKTPPLKNSESGPQEVEKRQLSF